MVSLVHHQTQDAAGTNGSAHTHNVETKTIVKCPLRASWSGVFEFTINARDDATGVCAGWRVLVAAHADAAGVITIDGTAVDTSFGDAALAAVMLSISTATAGHVAITTPGLAATDIWWAGDVEVWGNAPF